MLPAQQRFGADDLAGAEVDLGLIDDAELGAFQRDLKLCLKGEAGRDAAVELLVEELIAAAAARLGDVHGGIRVADELVGVASLLRERDPDGRGDPDDVVADVQRAAICSPRRSASSVASFGSVSSWQTTTNSSPLNGRGGCQTEHSWPRRSRDHLTRT